MAKRIRTANHDLNENHSRLAELVAASPAAGLFQWTGVGPVTAAKALVVWSHLGRVKSEAAFAVIAGVDPIPASSGKTVRHRLNRRGDRQVAVDRYRSFIEAVQKKPCPHGRDHRLDLSPGQAPPW